MDLNQRADLRRSDNRRRDGRAYLIIERGLWALAPAVLVFNLFSMPAFVGARQLERAQSADETAAVHRHYCEKWGMPVGSPAHAGCMRDLRHLRERIEQRIRTELAASF